MDMAALTIEVMRYKDAIFIPLPAALRQPITGGCTCHFCLVNPERKPSWDTMAVEAKKQKGHDTTWLVHYPSLSTEADCVPEAISLLIKAVEHSGYSVSGPTDIRAAEHGEPTWVCDARAAIAKATT